MGNQMKKLPGILIPILLGMVLSIILLGVSIIMAAAGHGSYLPAGTFFPGPVLIALVVGTFTPFVLVLASVQWPVYGLVVGIVRHSPRRSRYIKGMILQHLFLLALCFVFDREHDLGIDRLMRQFKSIRYEHEGNYKQRIADLYRNL